MSKFTTRVGGRIVGLVQGEGATITINNGRIEPQVGIGTIEACPQCGAQAVCEHGAQDERGRRFHLWDCPNCGRTQAIVDYLCSDCVGE